MTESDRPMNIATLQTQLPSIESLVQAQMPLKHRSTFWVGRCPFHDDQGRPNFVVFPQSQTWKCFVCGAQGDRIDWLTQTQSQSIHDLLHPPQPSKSPTHRPVPVQKPIAPVLPTATPATRHQAYQAWLRTVQLNAEDAAHLRQRGLTLEHITAAQFFSHTPGPLPPTLNLSPRQRIPGWYWNAADARWYSQGPAGIAIPIYTLYQQCAGFQIRTTHGGPKYQWLSSGRHPRGAPAQASPHFVPGSGRDLWITEGPIKAIIAHQIIQSSCIGIPGIGLWRSVIPWIQQLRPRHLYLALDQDSQPTVAYAVAQTVARLETIFRQQGWAYSLVHWDGPAKGLDDALVSHAPIHCT
jgi:hypothetical protein